MVDLAKSSMSASTSAWKEKELEDWLLAKRQLLDGEPLLPVRRQKPLSRLVDLLFIDRDRRLVLVELKNEKSTRLAVGQVLEYLSDYHDYDVDDLGEDCGRDLRADFQDMFGEPLNSLSDQRRVAIVAPGFDVPSSVACTYLGQVLRGVDVSMVIAKRDADGFALTTHEAPHLVWAKKLAPRSLAASPSGRQLFFVLESGAKPLLWRVGRIKSGATIDLPSTKRPCVFRRNRRLVPVSEFEGLDLQAHNTVWQLRDDAERLARLLGYVTTTTGEVAVVVRVRPDKPPTVRRMRKKKFLRDWHPSTQPLPEWSELAKDSSRWPEPANSVTCPTGPSAA